MVAGHRFPLIGAALLCGVGAARLEADIEADRVREAEQKAPPEPVLPKPTPEPVHRRMTPADLFERLGANEKRRRKNARRAALAAKPAP